MSLPRMGGGLGKWGPASCMPSPESPARGMVGGLISRGAGGGGFGVGTGVPGAGREKNPHRRATIAADPTPPPHRGGRRWGRAAGYKWWKDSAPPGNAQFVSPRALPEVVPPDRPRASAGNHLLPCAAPQRRSIPS